MSTAILNVSNGISKLKQQMCAENGEEEVPLSKKMLIEMPNGDETEFKDRVRNYACEAIRSESELRVLAEYAVDYAHTIGLVARVQEHKFASQVAGIPPLALLPSPFPRELFDQAMGVQTVLNELYFKVHADHEFMMEAYKDVVKGDPFIAKSVELAKALQQEGIHQKVSIALVRSDYLSHYDEQRRQLELKQVEVNVGQVGGPGQAPKLAKFYRKMLDQIDTRQRGQCNTIKRGIVPENCVRRRMAEAIFQAWTMFSDPNACIVFLTQSDLFPVVHFEQLQFIMFEVERVAKQRGQRIHVMTMTIKEAVKRIHLDESDFSLYADGRKKIALVHMTYGYLEQHYANEAEWNVRVAMERSTAIVSPNIRLQLCGTKKIQQLLARPGVLERFFPNEPEKIAQLKCLFCGIWGLESDDAATRELVEAAIKTPWNYVMKAQMGGGKGNYFDEELAQKLKTMDLDERGAYILQKKIWPITAKNYMLRPGQQPVLANLVTELGVYGAIIGDAATGQIVCNSVNGTICRSKVATVNQAGVSEGSGVLDSVFLFPAEEFL